MKRQTKRGPLKWESMRGCDSQPPPKEYKMYKLEKMSHESLIEEDDHTSLTDLIFNNKANISSRESKRTESSENTNSTILTRPYPNTFHVNLTESQQAEIAEKCITLTEETEDYGKETIRWWMKKYHPEEYATHETYNDWDSCFLKTENVTGWALAATIRQCVSYQTDDVLKCDQPVPDGERVEDQVLSVKEEIMSSDDQDELVIENLETEEVIIYI